MRAFHWNIMVEFYIKILPYLKVTVTYVVFSMLFGFLIGALIAAMRLSKHRMLHSIASIYVTIMRCVPSIVLLFLVYYGLPMILRNYWGLTLQNTETIVYVIVTFSLFLGASTSEIMRTAYLSVPKGQAEAAYMVGLTGWDTFWRIQFPQAFRVALPNVGNVIIYMIKEGSLAYTIGLQDILGRGYYLNGLHSNVYGMETYTALALIYWPLTFLLERIFKYIEKRGVSA